MRATFLIAFVVLSAPLRGGAAELRDVNVDLIDGHYLMHSEVRFDTSVEQLYNVLLDYDLGTRFSSVITESQNVEPDEQGRPQFFTRHKACLLFFCMNFERYGYVDAVPFETISATANPEISDFHVSREDWQFIQDGEGTILIYDVDLKPKFWVPPVIGPFILKRKLKKDGGRAIGRIEALAKAWPDIDE